MFLRVFVKGDYNFRFTCKTELVLNCWCSYIETIFTKIKLSSRNNKLFGNR